nr:hypothetical protein [Microbacterium pseudoresistens]
MTPTPRHPRRRTVSIAVLAVTAALLAGCTGEPDITPSSAPPPSPTASEPAAPALVPDGSADDNLPYFQQIVAQVWASDQRVSSRAYVDALTAAGFDRAAMQATYDVSTVDNPAESIQFSVRWGEAECLIGQVGPSTGDQPVTAVMPQLAEGRCLVGNTMPIDW